MMKVITTDAAPKAVGPYSQAIIASGFVFVSGQIAVDPKTNQFVDGSIDEQSNLVFKNLSAILIRPCRFA